MVDLINNTDTTFDAVFVRLLNIHFKMGIRDKSGMPEEVRSFSVRSMPPKKIVSPLCTRRLVSNLLIDSGGGEPSVGMEVKSEIFTFIPTVTWSSPETIGLMSTDRLASTGTYTLENTDVLVLAEGKRFCVVFL